MGQLTELKPTKTRQPAMVKPNSGGLIEKAAVVGTGIAVMATFGATLPLASAAAAVMVTVYFWDEIGKARNKDTSDELAAILAAKTPKHPSIQELRSQLKAQYPTEAINQAIESMIGHTEWVEFSSKDNHPLACFGQVYCWIDPDDPKNLMLPIERLEQLFTAWGIVPTVETTATPHQGEELASNPPEIALPQASQGTYSSTAAKELLTRLRSESPELLRLVKAPPIRLVGLQRTGKSTFAQRLALLRMVLLPGHSAAWATPHREADNPVPSVLNPVGYTATGAKDYGAIESLWAGTQDRIDQGETVNLTAVWDEFGGYDQFSDPEVLKGSLRSLLREASKHQYFPILIAHGDQAAFYPGVANILTTVRNSTVKVETVGAVADDFGTMRPTGKAVITWLDGSTQELTWPAWLTTDFLLGCLQESTQASPETPLAPPPPSPMVLGQVVDIDSHNGLEQPEGEPEEKPDPVAAKVAAKLAAKLETANGEWVSIRDLSVNLVSQPEEREIALDLIRQRINTYQLETMEKENPNKTISYFVRVKQDTSLNSNSPH